MPKLFVPLTLALLGTCLQAQAAWRTFEAHGHVTIATPTAPAGAKVTIRYAYDDATAANYSSGDAKGPGFGTANYTSPAKMTMRVNGHVMTAATTRIEVLNNAGGNVEDAISVYGGPMVLDGTTFPEGLFGFYLGSGPGNTKALRSIALPHRVDVRRFDAIGFQYGFAQTDGSSNGALLNVVIDTIEEVSGHDQHDN